MCVNFCSFVHIIIVSAGDRRYSCIRVLFDKLLFLATIFLHTEMVNVIGLVAVYDTEFVLYTFCRSLYFASLSGSLIFHQCSIIDAVVEELRESPVLRSRLTLQVPTQKAKIRIHTCTSFS